MPLRSLYEFGVRIRLIGRGGNGGVCFSHYFQISLLHGWILLFPPFYSASCRQSEAAAVPGLWRIGQITFPSQMPYVRNRTEQKAGSRHTYRNGNPRTLQP